MTTEQFYIHFLSELKSIYEESEAINISDWVFEEVTHLEKWKRRGSSIKLSDKHLIQLEQHLNELMQHKPVQYVLQQAWFYKRKFFVNEHVLIPRPETEELVKWVDEDLQSEQYNRERASKLLDVGTGSGCIAISLKKEASHLNVTAIDVSEKALSVAKKNAEELSAQIDFRKINFLKESETDVLPEYDIIVSNPPYIPERERMTLSKNVKEFEPLGALFVPDDDPFIFYKKIGAFAKSHLKPVGKIYLEIHENHATEVMQIFTSFNVPAEVKRDIYGKERMMKVFWNADAVVAPNAD